MSSPSGPAIGVFSQGIASIRYLADFLGARTVVQQPSRPAEVDVVVAWGNKATSERARLFAEQHQKPLWRLEDGFLRSVGTGATHPPLSLIVDKRGVYYDASEPSDLEELLDAPLLDAAASAPLANPHLLARAQSCIERVTSARLSKYNDQSSELPRAVLELPEGFVLVIDQTRGDASISGGLVAEDGFARMLEAALHEHPGVAIVIKTHPEVISGKKRGYLTELGTQHTDARVHVLGEHVNPLALIERASHVYTCTSQLGFEALLLGKRVSCFGVPFYAGWGLTDDRVPVPRRSRQRSVVELAAAAWLLYPRYVHPVRAQRCEAEEIIAHLELQREMFSKNNGRVHAFGFARWKRRFIRKYLGAPGGRLDFASGRAVPRNLGSRKSDAADRAVVWGRRGPEGLAAECAARGVALSYMEDGFLRSVGLGSDLTTPASLVVDSRGLYYDPARPSELELLLEHGEFSAAELERARALREAIVSAQLSKYNATPSCDLELKAAQGQRVVLVPGQVEDDASVQLGGAGIYTNRALLEAVRAAAPDAWLVYKPHPDVVSGNRLGKLARGAESLADQIVVGVPLATCLAAVQEVHTLTSLVGFEALLRGLPVATYGQPFYASFGLTQDRAPVSRRSRRLVLDELVAGVLLRYPRYYSQKAQAFVTAEDTIFELLEARSRQAALDPSAARFRRKWERLSNFLREVLGG